MIGDKERNRCGGFVWTRGRVDGQKRAKGYSRVFIRVISFAQCPIRFLDIPFGRRLGDSQYIVEVLDAKDQGQEGEQEESR